MSLRRSIWSAPHANDLGTSAQRPCPTSHPQVQAALSLRQFRLYGRLAFGRLGSCTDELFFALATLLKLVKIATTQFQAPLFNIFGVFMLSDLRFSFRSLPIAAIVLLLGACSWIPFIGGKDKDDGELAEEIETSE